MSVWNLIEQRIFEQDVALKFGGREYYVVLEAHASLVRRIVENRSAWDLLEALQMPVKGLDPLEVNIIRHFDRNAQSKQGNTGEVMQLDPKTWLKIKQEIESQSDYYNALLGGVGDITQLVKKIENALSLQMGSKPAAQKKAPVQTPPELSGKPSDITAAATGADMYKQIPAAAGGTGGSPFSSKSNDAERRKRVAAQDAAMMGGNTKPVGKVSVK